jgi:glutathione S-transferase
MILIGQYDSPYVRRVGVALRLYGIDFEHRPWSVFGDGDRIAALNPLRRVPTMVLDGGEVLVDSTTMIDHLDDLAGPARAMTPATGPARRAALRATALTTGLADKAVSLFYEHRLHETVSPVWAARCASQIETALAAIEADRAAAQGDWWQGDRMGHADIALACAVRFLADVHPTLWSPDRCPAVAAHAARCEAMAVFREISQPFNPPA